MRDGRGTTPLASRYRLLSVVGKGAMGTVWRAHDDLLERDVAVKEMTLPGWMVDEDRDMLRRRVLDEAHGAALLDHPGVPKVYDVVEQDGRPWIVMELVEGQSLRTVLNRDGPLEPAQAARIGRGLLAVLTAAHDHGILHRDVKPGNVLLTPDGRVVLTDFGLAVRRSSVPPRVTCENAIEGSPAYVSPEQARGDVQTPASDLWSLGALLYSAVEGRPPFKRDGALPSLMAILIDPYVPPRHAGPLRPVIDGLLRRDPAERLTAEQADRMLAAISDRPSPRRLFSPVATVAAIAVIVGVCGAWAARWTDVGTSDTLLTRQPAGATAGTVAVRETTGYSLDVPIGWTKINQPDGTYWQDPASPRYIRISRAPGDPLTGLRAAERALHLPGYRRLRLESDGDLVGGGAQWEYTWTLPKPEGSTIVRAMESRAYGFDLLFCAPDAHWTPSEPTFDAVLHSFHPHA
jgi:tRNA A-37 threonylcarbamoyl transferase component Bud32